MTPQIVLFQATIALGVGFLMFGLTMLVSGRPWKSQAERVCLGVVMLALTVTQMGLGWWWFGVGLVVMLVSFGVLAWSRRQA